MVTGLMDLKSVSAMDKQEIMQKVNDLLEGSGLKCYQNYIWSLQGPTLIYLGSEDPFKGLTVGQIKEIKEIGAHFLVEP